MQKKEPRFITFYTQRFTTLTTDKMSLMYKLQFCAFYFGIRCQLHAILSLTPSTPAVPNCCCSKGLAPYWCNPPFLIIDIRVVWRSGLSARAPECQKFKKNGGLHQYGKV